MTKRMMLAFVAIVSTLTLAAPAAQAQRRQSTPPEGYFDLQTQANRDGITQHMLKGADAQCRILQSYGMTGEPCERVAYAVNSGAWNELTYRSARYDAYTGQGNFRLPIIGDSYGHRGRNSRRFHSGFGQWFERGVDGFWSRDGDDRFGKYDDAELWGTVIAGAGGIYGERNRHKEEMKRIEMMDKHTPDADGVPQQTEPQVIYVPTTQQAPAPTTISELVFTNQTNREVMAYKGDTPVAHFLPGKSMGFAWTTEVVFQVWEKDRDCDLALVKDSDPAGDYLILCTN